MPKNEMQFEKALERLEKIVSELENGRVSLDDSLKKYEEGVKLSRICNKKLEEAQTKVEILMKKADNTLTKEPFEAQAFGSEAGKTKTTKNRSVKKTKIETGEEFSSEELLF